MLKKLDESSPVPLYQQIKTSIVECIESGEWKADERIPTELELEHYFGASRTTVRQAITELIDKNYLYRRRGVGTFVADAEKRGTTDSGWMLTINTNELIEISTGSATRRIIDMSARRANAETASRLGVEEGSEVFALERIQYGADKPLAYTMTYVNPEVAPRFLEDRKLVELGLHKYFEQAGCPVATIDYRITAVNVIDERVVSALGVEPGSANLLMYNTSMSADGRPIETSFTVINSELVSIPATYRY
jgi:GntR family transcriptional regulator